FKKKGYATSTVAHLSQKILDEGFQFCSLYTDSTNPTSNSIYKKIGYYEAGSSIVYKL
ncbi:GNAT family N-acetyltransferase, partial [Virgibacillus indicus]